MNIFKFNKEESGAILHLAVTWWVFLFYHYISALSPLMTDLACANSGESIFFHCRFPFKFSVSNFKTLKFLSEETMCYRKCFAHNSKDFRYWHTNLGCLGLKLSSQYPTSHNNLVADFIDGYLVYLYRWLAGHGSLNYDSHRRLKVNWIIALVFYCYVNTYYKLCY